MDKTRLILLLLMSQIAPFAYAQEKPLQLSGVFGIGYSNGHANGRGSVADTKVDNRTHSLDLGLDLDIRTYILHPRFIKISVLTDFMSRKGEIDQTATHNGIKGATLIVDFLQASSYPLRFHFSTQSSDSYDKSISPANTILASAVTARKEWGFDWQLRMPKLPKVMVNYDSATTDFSYLAASSLKSQSRTLSISAAHSYKGWEINSIYNNQPTTEGITNLNTNLNFVRANARKQLFKHSSLSINSFYENLRFESGFSGLTQNFSSFNVHTDFSSRLAEKFSIRLFHQYYYTVNTIEPFQPRSVLPKSSSTGDATLEPETSSLSEVNATLSRRPQIRQEMEREFFERSGTIEERRRTRRVMEEAFATNAAVQPLTSMTTLLNSLGGQASYRLRREITLNGTVDASLINTPGLLTEAAARFIDVAGTVGWNKRIGPVDTRASYTEGVVYAETNLGNNRQIRFRNVSAGVSSGNVKHALVSADYNYSNRPDTFEIGGLFSEKSVNGSIETEALRSFRVYASIGKNDLAYLTNRGRESFRRLTYSAGLEHRVFSLTFSHNSNIGNRDVFSIPFVIDPNRIIRVLPIETLIHDPLLKTSGFYTLGMLRVKPRHDLEIEARYLKDEVFFVTRSNVFGEQVDLLATYRLGKFTLTAGALFHQTAEGVLKRDRNYYFFRLSRPFKVL